jgi:hypothetical protein
MQIYEGIERQRERERERERDHVISGDERIVNSDEFNVISLQSDPRHQAPDPSESFTINLQTQKKVIVIHKKSSFKY